MFGYIKEGFEFFRSLTETIDNIDRVRDRQRRKEEPPVTAGDLACWADSTPQERACWELLRSCVEPHRSFPPAASLSSLPISLVEAVVLLKRAEEDFDFYACDVDQLKAFFWRESVKRRREFKLLRWKGEVPVVDVARRLNEQLLSSYQFEHISKEVVEILDAGILIQLSAEELEKCADLAAPSWCLLKGALERSLESKEVPSRVALESKAEVFLGSIKTMLDRCVSIGEIGDGLLPLFQNLQEDSDLQSSFVATWLANRRRDLFRERKDMV